MTPTLTAPNEQISESALLALYIVDICAHNVPDDMRERVLERLVEKGWTRDDTPSNNDLRSVKRPGSYSGVSLWPVRR